MKKIIVQLTLLMLSIIICESKSNCRTGTELTVTTIDSITFNRLKNESKKYNVDFTQTRLPSKLELQILDTILDYDKNIYGGDWFELYEITLEDENIKRREHYIDALSLSDTMFSFEYYNYKLDRHNDIIGTLCLTPIEAFTYLSFYLPDDKWETSSMRIPSRLMFVSNNGYVAGIEDTGDALYVIMDFFKIENFNNGDNKMTRKIGGYSSIETPLNDIYLFIPYDNSPKSEIGFWNHSKFYLKCLAIEPCPECRSGHGSEEYIYLCFDLKQNE